MTDKPFKLTKDQLAHAEMLEAEPVNWCKNHCRIVDKSANNVPLIMNVAQMHTERVITEMQAAGMPVRIVVLKARQHGETTRGAARQFRNVNIYANRSALIAAHDKDATLNIFRKVQMFQDENPRPLPARYSTRNELTYDRPHRSYIIVDTGGKQSLGRSGKYDYVHISELAFFEHPEQTMLSVKQCVPKLPHTEIVLESTANGTGGYFHNAYLKARKSPCDKDLHYMVVESPSDEEWNGYYRVFNPWFIDKEYAMSVPAGFVLSENEQAHKDRYRLTDEQLAWRRWAIAELCGGDEELFKQEYPSNDREAFISSGRLYFPATQLTCLEEHTRPAAIGRFMFGYGDENKPVLEPNEHEGWEIDEFPVPGRIYALFGDPAEGLDPTETNDPEKTDRSVAHVMDVAAKKIVAKLRCRFHEDIFAEQLALAAQWYNVALLGFELNNKCGGSLKSELKRFNYQNLYRKRRYDKAADEWTEKIGWTTDKITKPMMYNDLRQIIRGYQPNYKPEIFLFSKETVRELFTYITDKDGKTRAQSGEYDDEVAALAGVVQMAMEAAGSMSLGDYVGDAMENEDKRLRPEEEFTTDNLAYAGVKDNVEDILEDDYEM